MPTSTPNSPTPLGYATFAPVEGDLAFVRHGSLWIADTVTGDEHEIVPIPYAEQGWNPIAGPPIWHPLGRWLAFLSYEDEDLAAQAPTDQATITFVDLETGQIRRRPDLQAAVAGSLAWDDRMWSLTFISALSDENQTTRVPVSHSAEQAGDSFAGNSKLVQVAAPDGAPQSLIEEAAPNQSFNGPVVYVHPNRYRYVRLYNDGMVNIEEFDAAARTTTSQASLMFHAVKRPYPIPTLALPERAVSALLITSPFGGLEEQEGLYSFVPNTPAHPVEDHHVRHILPINAACGLIAGAWQGHVALGCGMGENTSLLICDVEGGSCDDLASALIDRIQSLILPNKAPLNALKFRPIHWTKDGVLYIIATAYAAGQPWSGDGHLVRIDYAAYTTGEAGADVVTHLLGNVDAAAFRPIQEEPEGDPSLDRIISGTVVRIEEASLILDNSRWGRITVHVTETTRIWKGGWEHPRPIEIGDDVVGVGEPDETLKIWEAQSLEVNIINLRGEIIRVAATAEGIDVDLKEIRDGKLYTVHIPTDLADDSPGALIAGSGLRVIGLRLDDGTVLAETLY
jgi:hypothetical protein